MTTYRLIADYPVVIDPPGRLVRPGETIEADGLDDDAHWEVVA